ncbi:hypothetical protein LJ707_06735 [Mucilaginibacter sp. UR6-1]|uniref:hypothetical protein n=1 Tax=Mucilaginibacter sp. UR6-1 TaxID=1435643 RepID=UPI001E466064|nr:hypothetical protein [Mucilaginibacter sp. UR6-1]MCC8408618.1 hypothetical protein [Mucilaginibacter sp. UR6-1]
MATKLNIESIWWRNVQPGEFYNIERHHRIEGGGGSLYIEIPSSMVPQTLNFLDVTETDFNSMASLVIEAFVIGNPKISGPIEFRSKAGGRMRIANQNRRQPSSQRHPAWTSTLGFPRASDEVSNKNEALEFFPEGGLRIYIAKTVDGNYYAGFTKGHRPSNIKENNPMFELYSTNVGGVINAKHDR